MKVAPWIVLAHIFATDIVTVEGGERFDAGGGLFGLIQRFRMKRKAANEPANEAGKGVDDAA